MNEFKVGDYVRGIAGNGYNLTNERLTLAKVTATKNADNMKIKIMEHDASTLVGSEMNVTNSASRFELVVHEEESQQEKLEELLKVGDMVEYDDGYHGVWMGTYMSTLPADWSSKYAEQSVIRGFTGIKKVKRPSNGKLFVGVLKREWETGTIVWKRPETKKLTVGEISELLGYEIEIVKE